MKEHYLSEIRISRLEPRKSNLDSEAILEKVISKVSKDFGELARDPPSLFLHWPRVLQLGAGGFGRWSPAWTHGEVWGTHRPSPVARDRGAPSGAAPES